MKTPVSRNKTIYALKCLNPFLAITACLAFAPAAFAVSYTASTGNGGTFTDITGVTSSGEVGLVGLPNGAQGSLSEFAAASQAGLQARSQASIDSASLSGLGSGLIGASATASGTWYDFVISGPSGMVPVYGMNLVLNGSFGTNAIQSNNWANVNNSSVSVTLSGNIAGQSFSGGYQQTKEGYSGNVTASASGIFATPGTIPVNVTTPTFTVATGDIFSVSLQLATGASAHYVLSASSGDDPKTLNIFSLADFSNTLTFATSGPVFNLPDGYTVNSIDAMIVDNRWVPAASVPEPSTAELLVLGCVLAAPFAIARGRRKCT